MTWKITSTRLDNENLLVNESLFSLGNGYLGVRGNFEEGYQEKDQTIRGTYLNAFHDEATITYGEKLYGFPDKQQKIANLIDSQTVEIYIDDERFSLFSGEIIHFKRHLHMNDGFVERIIHWKSPQGKEVNIHFKRLVSFVRKELFAIDITVEPISKIHQVKIVSTVNGDVANFVDPNDPRVASGHAKCLHIDEVKLEDQLSIVKNSTYHTVLDVACVTSTKVNASNYTYENALTDYSVEEVYRFDADETICFTKYNVYTDTLRHEENVIEAGKKVQLQLQTVTFDQLLTEQKEFLADFWHRSDVEIVGDENLQEGIRFNIYQLLQSAGRDSVSNIAAKGLSGEGYEGHYFWDTEIYMIPVFLMTNPDIAKNLLVYRHSILDSARARAKEMGHEKGALFPWRTISGSECSPFFPAGTAQYHISADVAYSYIQYYLVTKDDVFLADYMAEVLFETARLWIDMGHFLGNEFRIDNVTGPDEYTCIVNNNYYTNSMAKHNLLWAAKAYKLLQDQNEDALQKVIQKIGLHESEMTEWQVAGEKMYLPYDDINQISAQDDSFLQKDRWNLENTPKEKFPLLLNYHPLTLYRYQVCKQADTVLSHFLLEDEQHIDTIRNSYHYYEQITTHDSSLSHCVFSIMGSKLGLKKKAYNYFIETARLDLDNTHDNTKDGLHMANMGGTWLAIVYGFAGVRVKESGLSLSPSLPEGWESLAFRLQYEGKLIHVKLTQQTVTYSTNDDEGLAITHNGESVILTQGEDVQFFI